MKIFERYYSFITAVVVFIIYLTTLAPTIIHLDAGELTTVQSTLGIAHPTGYPLFAIVGFIVSKLFFFFNSAIILNLLAALYCSLAVFMITKIVHLSLNSIDEVNTKKKDKKKNEGLTSFHKTSISLVIGLIAGLSKTFWFQSTSVEVYSLHLFLLSCIIYYTLRAYTSGNAKYWYFVALFLALGFSNHMTTILILPGIAFLFFKQNGFKQAAFITIAKMLLIFIPLLLVLYSYLPIRAFQDPLLNWGNPIDFEKLIRHVSGKQYQVWIFSSTEAAKEQLAYFFENLPKEFGYAALATSIIGIPLTFKKIKVLSIFFTINFLITLLYSINYDIADIDSYFLLSFISLAFFSIGLLIKLAKYVSDKSYLATLVIPLILILVNFTSVNQSNKFIFEDYTKSILNNSEKNSIVLSYLWDYFVSPSYYFQYVEGYRNDVAIIDKELIRRSWYYEQLKNSMPTVISNVESEYIEFLEALEPFEKEKPYNAELLESRFRNLLTSLISNNIDKYDFYVTPEMVEKEIKTGELTLPKGYTLVPMELVFKVVLNNGVYIPANSTKIKLRFSSNPNKYEMFVKNLTVNMMLFRIIYELQYNQKENARNILIKVQTEFPEYRIPPTILQQLGG